jgi:lysophospholipase L1-like esterase
MPIKHVFFSIIAFAIVIIFCEGTVRLLQVAGIIEHISIGTAPRFKPHTNTEAAKHNAPLIPIDDPVLAWKLDPNNKNINKIGTRGSAYSTTRTERTCRIAILGDSYAYGFSVPYDQSFAGLLEKRLSEKPGTTSFEILNFGVIGYGTTQQLQKYKKDVEQYNPDIVLLAYVLNDLGDPKDAISFFSGLSKSKKRLKLLSTYSQLLAFFYLQWTDINLSLQTMYHFRWLYLFENRRWANTQTAIAEMNTRVRNNNGLMVAAIFPFFNADTSGYPYIPSHDSIGEVFKKNNIPYIDLINHFDQHDLDNFKISDVDNHPNAMGHKVSADAIFNFLKTTEAIETYNPDCNF